MYSSCATKYMKWWEMFIEILNNIEMQLKQKFPFALLVPRVIPDIFCALQYSMQDIKEILIILLKNGEKENIYYYYVKMPYSSITYNSGCFQNNFFPTISPLTQPRAACITGLRQSATETDNLMHRRRNGAQFLFSFIYLLHLSISRTFALGSAFLHVQWAAKEMLSAVQRR